MRRTDRLSSLLRRLVELIEDEAGRNPAFSERLESLLSALPAAPGPSRGGGARSQRFVPVPDVLGALESKGEQEFRYWLRSLDLQTLKAIIRANGFDAAKASRRWATSDKFIDLIAQQAQARLRRGSAFLPPRGETKPPQDGGGATTS